MGYAIEVDRDNFQQEVIENSHEKPVIIDFYATWCGPCQLLKPILENLLKEYDFILAKIDIDRNPQLAQQFHVEGVPDVKIAVKGEVVSAFVGALPEAEIRALLGKFNLQSDLTLKLEAGRRAIAEQNAPKAKQIFDELFAQYPEHPQVILEAAKFLIRLNYLAQAQRMLKTIKIDHHDYYQQAQSLNTLLDFQQTAENSEDNEFDQVFAKATQLTLIEDYEGALGLFLQIVEQNRQYRQDGARKAMIAIFNLLGNQHPLSKKYQQDLMLALY